MVGIDIHSLNLEELSGVVDMYPWYGAARMELCSRMLEMGALSEGQISATALYVGSRKIIYNLLKAGRKEDCSDKDAREIAGSLLPAGESSAKRVYVVGGDYFSQSQYEGVRRSDDNIFPTFATGEGKGTADMPEVMQESDFCTETLAQIYLEQDYPEQAKEIYSKLILRYPEKSVYFASLIDEINKKNE